LHAGSFHFDFDFAEFAIPFVVIGIEADGVGVAAVVEGAADAGVDVVVAVEGDAAGAVGEEAEGVQAILACEECGVGK
jgi:hypothetical protein